MVLHFSAFDQQFHVILVRNVLYIGACANAALLTYTRLLIKFSWGLNRIA